MSQSLRQYCKAVLNSKDYETLVSMVLERVGTDMFTEETCEILNDASNGACQTYAIALISLWASYQYYGVADNGNHCPEFAALFGDRPEYLQNGCSKYDPDFASIVSFILYQYC